MSEESTRPGRGWGTLVLEAVMVVFAVLVALAVDEWAQARQLDEQVARARAGIEAELRSNQAELERGSSSVRDMYQRIAGAVERLAAGEELTDYNLGGEIPDFSDAAWETARATGAVALMDYEWVLATARVYETQELTLRTQTGLLDLLGPTVVREPDVERYRDLQGQLFMMLQMYMNLERQYAETLGQEGSEAAAGDSASGGGSASQSTSPDELGVLLSETGDQTAVSGSLPGQTVPTTRPTTTTVTAPMTFCHRKAICGSPKFTEATTVIPDRSPTKAPVARLAGIMARMKTPKMEP